MTFHDCALWFWKENLIYVLLLLLNDGIEFCNLFITKLFLLFIFGFDLVNDRSLLCTHVKCESFEFNVCVLHLFHCFLIVLFLLLHCLLELFGLVLEEHILILEWSHVCSLLLVLLLCLVVVILCLTILLGEITQTHLKVG